MFGLTNGVMTTTRSVMLVVLVAVIGLTAAPMASGAVVGTLTGDTSDDAGDTDAGNDTETDVSTFMQSSAVDTANTVESGMVAAKYERADEDDRPDIVLERTGELEERVAELRSERADLQDGKDDLHPGEYRAKITQLTVEIQSLERSIDRTEQRAAETGVDDQRLEELRQNASELTGQEMTAIARGLAGPDGTSGGGPPDAAGNQSTGPGNGPGGADDGPPSAADPGQPDDRGNDSNGESD